MTAWAAGYSSFNQSFGKKRPPIGNPKRADVLKRIGGQECRFLLNQPAQTQRLLSLLR